MAELTFAAVFCAISIASSFYCVVLIHRVENLEKENDELRTENEKRKRRLIDVDPGRN